ncbi:drug resistance transporter, Bcr/CflA family [Anaerovibrio sp. JC8]|uniref:multidrug effflux MFS transporter n=1 Tax=Anaerovibrio sp. JC8 TaxID=1240085 RepID=UPI000A0B0230|nr:multidrug effflux MFS transporter [Anaerovibrio sp. JC8]ORT98878.1 drug resistance transporter, Bcr/CflA family [Anaerovibrio sp. JC8]
MSKTKSSVWLVIFLGIMSAMAPLATDMYLPALPVMQSDYGISTSVAQMTLTMTMLGMAIGQIFAGPISDMRGRKMPLFVGMVVFMAMSATCAVATDIRLFLAARFVQGFAGACGIVISRAIARDLCKGPELTRFFSILMMVNGLAPILAPVLGGQILAFGTWRYVFGVLGLIGLVMAGATILFKESLPVERRLKNLNRTILTFPILMRNKYFMGHCLVQMFEFAAFFTYIGCSSFVFQGIYDVSPQVYSYIFGGIGISLMVSGGMPAKLSGRVKDETMLRCSLYMQAVMAAVLIGVFAMGASLPVVIALLVLGIAPLSIVGAASFSLGLSSQGRNAGSASALLGCSSMVLGAVMMPVVGIFGTDSGIPMAVMMLIGFTLAVVACEWYIMPAHKKNN